MQKKTFQKKPTKHKHTKAIKKNPNQTKTEVSQVFPSPNNARTAIKKTIVKLVNSH